jgi:hypothetical protein
MRGKTKTIRLRTIRPKTKRQRKDKDLAKDSDKDFHKPRQANTNANTRRTENKKRKRAPQDLPPSIIGTKILYCYFIAILQTRRGAGLARVSTELDDRISRLEQSLLDDAEGAIFLTGGDCKNSLPMRSADRACCSSRLRTFTSSNSARRNSRSCLSR